MPEGLKIVLVEDDAHVRDSLSQSLELAGFAVRAFDSAEAAIGHLPPGFPGIVISDVRLPGMDGLAFMRRVLESNADVPVILVTGHGDISMAVRAIREGAYDFIEKPFPVGRLVDAVVRAESWQRRRLT
ncbi:sigma-54-dependent Fis family transcriptional regulator [Aquincola sp. S2]|uniref:Sigma-54-dependent Fis family transcriptional regulator n=1 Tax=Pseudaquabacterium terrae TaxID=2732868 RepID=A0ABX2EGW4_9BURK|nr:sigma-54-dependent Fis family transcriptional regulator [Aquabacterium terrae]NRF67816.1 sigma-54-dependent Fis family transcriptional regulator [Aquabacterium terrae]